MPEEQARSGNRRFYRRINDKHWQDRAGRIIQDTVFRVRDDTEGLSVFDADRATPRAVLQHQINLWQKAVQNPKSSERFRAKAEANLQQCNNSVEGMLEQGWGVVEVPEALFRRCGFQPSSQIDTQGHLVFEGMMADFEEQSLEIVADPACRVLSDEECCT